MTERQQQAYEAMTPERRDAVDRIRASHAQPAFRAEEGRVRAAIAHEFPPASPGPITVAAMDRLRREA